MMKYLISIYLWIAGSVSITLILVIGIIFTCLFAPETYDPWFKKLLRLFFKILHVKVITRGCEKLAQHGTYLFMPNHVSLFDLPLLGGYIPVFFRGVEAAYQFNWLLYGWFIRRYGNIPIERNNIHRSITSIRMAEKSLREGKSIAIMPEGHRTLDGKLGRFKKLPFFLAQQAEVDIVPIGLSGLYK
ncbi:MAG: lysophospholipid acyltransferase family protein, partial [bacterium]